MPNLDESFRSAIFPCHCNIFCDLRTWILFISAILNAHLLRCRLSFCCFFSKLMKRNFQCTRYVINLFPGQIRKSGFILDRHILQTQSIRNRICTIYNCIKNFLKSDLFFLSFIKGNGRIILDCNLRFFECNCNCIILSFFCSQRNFSFAFLKCRCFSFSIDRDCCHRISIARSGFDHYLSSHRHNRLTGFLPVDRNLSIFCRFDSNFGTFCFFYLINNRNFLICRRRDRIISTLIRCNDLFTILHCHFIP